MQNNWFNFPKIAQWEHNQNLCHRKRDYIECHQKYIICMPYTRYEFTSWSCEAKIHVFFFIKVKVVGDSYWSWSIIMLDYCVSDAYLGQLVLKQEWKSYDFKVKLLTVPILNHSINLISTRRSILEKVFL